MNNISIKQRFSLWSGISLLLTIAACTWVGWWQFNSISTQQAIQTEQTMLAHAESYVRSVASVESLHIKALFEQRLKVAATMASIATETAQNTRPDKRIQLSDFLKLLMKENPEYFGSYYAFEPNALDGRDSEYLGMPGQDENGRFQPYGTRENKQVTVVSLLALEDQTKDNNGVRAGEYYLCSKELIRRCTIGPYIYPVDGKDTLLASVSAPIVSNGQLIGVAGLDISAEFLQTLTAKLSKSVYDGTGTLILLSSAGVIAGHSTQEKFVGSNIRSLQKDEEQIISDSINKKDVSIQQTDTVFTLAMPFYIDEETVPWVMYISIPKAKVLEHAYKQQEFMLVAKQNFAETLILVGALLAGLGIGTVWLVSKNSIAPLKQMTTMISQIAEGDGDLTKTLTITRDDEVGELAAHVNTFIQRLQTMISSLVVVGEQVGQLSTQSNEIGKLTDGQVMHQQALLEQVVTAITEMSATAQEVARSAANAADAVKQAEVATSNGNTVVKQTVNAVSTVKESSEQARTSMQQLESNSKEIFSILSVIQGIAEQTNLLALNAAIEAARAGEQGRGFAVVADEVRALAGRTRSATEEIGVMLNHLQEGSRKAAAMMQSSNERVQETVQSALQAEQAITQIQQAIAQISQMNFQIAAATEEQSLVCDDINHNIAKIAAVATDTAKSASSLRLLGEEQDKTANALKRQLGQFKV